MANKLLIGLSTALVAASFSIPMAHSAKKLLRCPQVGFYQTLKTSKKCPAKKMPIKKPIDDGSHGGGNGGGGGGGGTPSDFRLKHNLERVGTTVYGLPLYDFEYNFKSGIYEGVMAQDVLKVRPEAVSVGKDGYYRVNYDLLGISMKRIR